MSTNFCKEPTLGATLRQMQSLLRRCLSDTVYLAVAVMLLGMLALLLGLSIPNMRYGLPYLSSFDEGPVLYWVANAMNSGDLIPRYFRYGSVPFYLTLIADTAAYFWSMSHGYVEHYIQFLDIRYGTPPYYGLVFFAPEFVLWPRIMFAMIGSSSIFLVYRLALFFRWPWAGVIGAFVLAVAPLH
jgi:hypothetical protein